MSIPRPTQPTVETSREGLDAEPSTILLVPRGFAHLPAKRWSWAARRRMTADHPFGRIAEIEANLEQLVDELEAEVDRLVAQTGALLQRPRPAQ